MTNHIHFYDLMTGILSSHYYIGPTDLIAQNTPPGTLPVEGVTDAPSQRVDIVATAAMAPPATYIDPIRGRTFATPPALLQAVIIDYQPPAPPDDTMQSWAWDTVTKRWRSVATFAALQSQKWTVIKAERDVALNAPLLTVFGTFDSDLVSRANIAGAVALAQTLASASPPFAITYTLADNTSVTLDGPSMVNVGLALGAKVQAAFARARALRLQIESATTSTTLDAITWI